MLLCHFCGEKSNYYNKIFDCVHYTCGCIPDSYASFKCSSSKYKYHLIEHCPFDNSILLSIKNNVFHPDSASMRILCELYNIKYKSRTIDNYNRILNISNLNEIELLKKYLNHKNPNLEYYKNKNPISYNEQDIACSFCKKNNLSRIDTPFKCDCIFCISCMWENISISDAECYNCNSDRKEYFYNIRLTGSYEGIFLNKLCKFYNLNYKKETNIKLAELICLKLGLDIKELYVIFREYEVYYRRKRASNKDIDINDFLVSINDNIEIINKKNKTVTFKNINLKQIINIMSENKLVLSSSSDLKSENIISENKPILSSSSDLKSENTISQKNNNYSETIPKALKDCVWIKYMGNIYQTNCLCCNINSITAVNFHCGHIIPYSKGGYTNINNLVPICSVCNLSMSTNNMIEWCQKYFPNAPLFKKLNINNKQITEI